MATRSRKQNASLLKAQAARRGQSTAVSEPSENDPVEPRISPRTVEKLSGQLSEAHSEVAALTDRTNILRQQRETNAREGARYRFNAETEKTALAAEHASVLSQLNSRIAQLESEVLSARSLVETMRAKVRAAEKREERFDASSAERIARETAKAVKTATTFRLMESGRYTDSCRALVVDLAAAGVPTEKIGGVIRTVADAAGLTVLPERSVSGRSCGRFVGEGGLASTLQVAEKLMDNDVTGICLSSDGTSDNNMQFISRHVTVTTNGVGETLCLGLTRPVDHTSDTQFREWLDSILCLAGIYDATRLSETEVFCHYTFWRLFKGTNSDHASDQAATTRKLYQTKLEKDLEARGYQAVRAMPPVEVQALICQEKARMVDRCGGVLAWLQMPTADRERHEAEMHSALILRMGQAAYDALSPAQKASVKFFVRAGCCMHKELNCVLAGVKAMMASWAAAGVPGPKKLYNRDNTVLADSDSPEARAHAEEATQAGGVKAAQLFGGLFICKDDKRGYGDLFVTFLEHRLKRRVRIPDSKTCRYQSNYETARFMLHHRTAILDFMKQVKSNKTSHKLNNMELNVWEALCDGPTLSELVALARYGTAIGRPYMRQVRADGVVNLMELGPLHERVILQCDKLHNEPELLSGTPGDESQSPATLDGAPFDDPGLFDVVLALDAQGLLPCLSMATAAFFRGARDGWKHFTPEFSENGAITLASDAERASLVIPATNDTNEGLLGMYRVWKRLKPRMRLRFFNALAMYKRNKTGKFLSGLDSHIRRWLRREQRRRDALGLSKREDAAQVAHEAKKQQAYEKAQQKRAEDAARRERELTEFEPTRFLTLTEFRGACANSRAPGAILDLNIRWHRSRGSQDVQKKLAITRPLPKLVSGKRALLGSILAFLEAPEPFGGIEEPFPLVQEDSGSRRPAGGEQDAMDCSPDS